jgi:lactoylglutathione lyase
LRPEWAAKATLTVISEQIYRAYLKGRVSDLKQLAAGVLAAKPPLKARVMLTVSSIAHVAIRVKDVQRSLEFYVGRLGFKEMMRLERDGKLWLLYLRITDSQHLEVFPDGIGDRAAEREAIGYNHLCLEVPDIDETVRELAASGVAMIRPKTLAADGNWQTWIEDPDGHRIELMQMMPDCLQLRAIQRLRT